MRRRALISLLLALMLAFSRAAEAQSEAPDSITWPAQRGEYPTLQSAINALRVGGKLSIQKGRYELSQALVIHNKRLTIEGAGCAELPRGKSGNDHETHLIGPRPERVVPFDEVAGLVTYVAGGAVTGGTLRGLRIDGLDAGIRIASGDAAEAGKTMLTIEDTCIAEGGRGIAISAPGAKVVAKNLLVKNVLGNGISISPSVVAGLADLMFESFGLTVINAGQACVVVKNALFNAFQDSFHNCGFNVPLPGAGAGVVAIDAGVNFVESFVNNPNGTGIAARGSTTFIQNSSVFFATGFGVLLFQPLYGSINDLHVAETGAFPPGHPQAGRFGDGIAVAGPGPVWVGNSLIENSDRAGLSNFGSFVDLGDTKIECSGFDLEGEPYPTSSNPFLFNDRGGVQCGCPQATGQCLAESAGIEPPLPVEVAE